ncbi:MAG: GDP-mannose 4,6-dehydratase [Acidobacteria bacterium]|nr:GDP-mannose 4,6-dehydratase [Acidobacteriota bacterium]
MNVLITGGAGFIGSHLTERLIRDGDKVSILDDLNDFYAPRLKEANLDAVRRAGTVSFHPLDIRDEARVMDVFASERPEAVIHLAARAGVRPSLEQPLLYEEVNVRGTLILLEACRRFGVGKFVFASSSSVYGSTCPVPFHEADALHPISPYAATKLAGEQLCYTYWHLYGIRIVCLRFFTVYGPRQRPDLAIRKFTEMIAEGKPIPVFGDGSASRDYTYVDDTVEGIMGALSCDAAYEIFNLGNSTPVDLLTMIRTIEAKLGRSAQIRWLPKQPGDVPITFADISKAGRELNYHPRTPFAEGIGTFVDWYLNQDQRTPSAVR